jgi:flagellar L-ring protein precursor FlgH
MFNLLLLFVLDVSAQGSEEAPVAEPSDPVASEVDASETQPEPAAEADGSSFDARVPSAIERPVSVMRRSRQVLPSAGSVWVETEALQLLGLEGNARQVGDLITVKITERTSTLVDSETRTGRSSTVGAGVGALFGLESSMLSSNPNMGESIKLDVSTERDFEGSGTTSRGATATATITCEVVEVMPSGNLLVHGTKQVRVNREVHYVVLKGLVRPQDIQMDNTVTSDLLAQAQIEITGQGVVADPQGPGIGTRILDRVWPF